MPHIWYSTTRCNDLNKRIRLTNNNCVPAGNSCHWAMVFFQKEEN